MFWNPSLHISFLLMCIFTALDSASINAQTLQIPPVQVSSSAPEQIGPSPLITPTTPSGSVPAEGAVAPDSNIPNPAFSLAQLEQIALGHNPTLVQAAMRIQAAQGQCQQVGLYPNPVVGYVSEEMGANGTAGFQGAFVGQEIVTAGKLKLNQAVANQEIQQAQWAWQAQMHRVLNDVRTNYFEVLYAQQTIEIDEQLLRIGEENVKAADKLFTAKEVSRVDVLQARVETDATGLSLQNARNRHQAIWQQLTAVVGLPDMETFTLAGRLEDDIPQLDQNTAWQTVLAQSPQLAEARAGLERTRCEVARQCAERVPNIDLRGRVEYDNELGDNIAGVEVGLPLPLFNRNQGNITKAQSQLIAAQNEIHRVELGLRQRFASIFEQYLNARQQVQKYSDNILPNAAKTLELVRAGYQQGEFNYQALLIAQRTYFQANLSYLESLRQLHTSAISLDGLLLSGGLQPTVSE
jgi:outer membrane protein, heavy metal efflux system